MTNKTGLNIRRHALRTLLMALICTASNTLGGTVISFDEVLNGALNQDRTSPLTSQGFVFSSGHFHIIDVPSACALGGCAVLNGSQYLAVDGPQLGQTVDVTRTGGGLFDVLSLQVSRLFVDGTAAAFTNFANADELVLAGELAGGGTVSISIALPALPSFDTFFLPSTFANLRSLRISGSVAASTDDASWAIDNLAARYSDEPETDPSSIPEPGSALLLAPALAIVLLRFRGTKLGTVPR